MRSLKNPTTIILLLAALEVLCATYFLYIPKFDEINSFVFLFAGLGISVCLLITPPQRMQIIEVIDRQVMLKLLFIALLLPISYQLARRIMDHTPLQIEYGDMLPIIKTMCTRFQDGHWHQVYEPIPAIWNGVQPIYLPAMWLPFTSALLLDFDLRWITVCGIWLSVILCLLPKWRRSWQPFLQVALLLTLLSWFHADNDNNVIRLTEEGVIFFYYALLTAAIFLMNPWLIGICLGLCLLSRYACIGWVPFTILLLLLTRRYSFLLKTIGASAFVVLFILILPFGPGPLSLQLHLQHEYISQAAKVWRDNPEFFHHSLGMAKLFGPHRLELLHSILIAGTFLIPLVFLFIVRKKNFSQPSILLAGFQLSLTFFYNFLDISYLYLFYTPVFVSLMIAGWTVCAQPRENSSLVNSS